MLIAERAIRQPANVNFLSLFGDAITAMYLLPDLSSAVMWHPIVQHWPNRWHKSSVNAEVCANKIFSLTLRFEL